MKYENMEVIDSDIMAKVFDLTKNFDCNIYTDEDILNAINKDSLNIFDLGALLSPNALKFLNAAALKAKYETKKHFGSCVSLFTPLYISNYCENHCTYCGFNCKNKINRAKLSFEEIEQEYVSISKTGLKEILILTGESRIKSDVSYIANAVKLATKYFSTVGIEIYPLNTGEYNLLKNAGADFVSVYQETYNTQKYKELHLSGPKTVFDYRFYSQERALKAGMRGVSFGVLLGLSDFRKDVFACAVHAYLTQQKYPHTEINFSVPRLRPYINKNQINANDVYETQLLQAMIAYRLFMPFAGITISTRERSGFRDNVIGMCVTKISAGVKTGVGGHNEKEKGDAQFEIADSRNVEEIVSLIEKKGLQPVFTNYIRT